MMLFPRLLKLADVVAVQGSHDADAREHRRAAKLNHQHQSLDRGLPFGQG
jgi:hypothetical protein